MLDTIFETMFSSGSLKYVGAFFWGIASVILSPCGISMLPLVIGYVENTDNPTRLRAFKVSCAFCLGIIFNLLLIAFIMSSLGMLLGGYERLLTVLVAVVFIVMGLHLTGIIHVKILGLDSRIKGTESQTLRGAIILGILSGLAVGPCNIAYVSPVLSLAMSNSSVTIVLAYALGYCSVLIAAGTFAQLFTGYLQSERGDKILKWVNVLCGLGLVAGGIYLFIQLLQLL